MNAPRKPSPPFNEQQKNILAVGAAALAAGGVAAFWLADARYAYTGLVVLILAVVIAALAAPGK